MTEYLFAIQDSGGREVCNTRLTVEKVGDVTGHLETGRASIRHNGKTIAQGTVASDDGFSLVRVPADDKLAEPVVHPVIQE